MFKWHTIDSRWDEVRNGTIGNDKFPDCTIQALNDNVEFVPLTDGFTKQDGHMGLSVRVGGVGGKFLVYDQNQNSIPVWDGTFDLPDGDQMIGVYVMDKNAIWAGFKWINVKIGNGTQPSNKSIFPLAVGNKWRYETIDYWSDGTVSDRQEFTVEIMADTTLPDASHWYIMSEKHQDDTENFEVMIASKSDGIWYRVPDGSVTPFLWYAYPADVGHRYSTGVDGHTNVEIRNTGKTVSLPIETFNQCYEYRFDVTGRSTAWYTALAPDVGVVQSTDYQINAGGSETKTTDRRLISYDLK
jgi:hypothetical protein